MSILAAEISYRKVAGSAVRRAEVPPNFLLSLSGLELSYLTSRGPTIKMPQICLLLIAPARVIKVHCAVYKVGYFSVTVLFPSPV